MSDEVINVMDTCLWGYVEWLLYVNYLVFAMAIASIIAVLWIICHVQHGRRRINALTMRPWRVVLICLVSVGSQTITNDPSLLNWSIWFSLERVNKLFNVFLSVTMIHEKHILSLFMLYQVHFDLRQHDVMKDKFRELEQKENNSYWT